MILLFIIQKWEKRVEFKICYIDLINAPFIYVFFISVDYRKPFRSYFWQRWGFDLNHNFRIINWSPYRDLGDIDGSWRAAVVREITNSVEFIALDKSGVLRNRIWGSIFNRCFGSKFANPTQIFVELRKVVDFHLKVCELYPWKFQNYDDMFKLDVMKQKFNNFSDEANIKIQDRRDDTYRNFLLYLTKNPSFNNGLKFVEFEELLLNFSDLDLYNLKSYVFNELKLWGLSFKGLKAHEHLMIGCDFNESFIGELFFFELYCLFGVFRLNYFFVKKALEFLLKFWAKGFNNKAKAGYFFFEGAVFELYSKNDDDVFLIEQESKKDLLLYDFGFDPSSRNEVFNFYNNPQNKINAERDSNLGYKFLKQKLCYKPKTLRLKFDNFKYSYLFLKSECKFDFKNDYLNFKKGVNYFANKSKRKRFEIDKKLELNFSFAKNKTKRFILNKRSKIGINFLINSKIFAILQEIFLLEVKFIISDLLENTYSLSNDDLSKMIAIIDKSDLIEDTVSTTLSNCVYDLALGEAVIPDDIENFNSKIEAFCRKENISFFDLDFAEEIQYIGTDQVRQLLIKRIYEFFMREDLHFIINVICMNLLSISNLQSQIISKNFFVNSNKAKDNIVLLFEHNFFELRRWFAKITYILYLEQEAELKKKKIIV